MNKASKCAMPLCGLLAALSCAILDIEASEKIASGTSASFHEQRLKNESPGELAGLVWDAKPEFVARGGYGRANVLSSGEIALVWADGPVKDTAVYIKKKPSKAGGAWGPAIRVASPGKNPDYRYLNSEMTQLADGRLFYTWNARPIVRDGHLPYKIMCAFSDDGGATWSAGRDLYIAGDTWKTGCWEPCPIQLPDGELQVWFSNEATTPEGDQNITVLRSRDNGATWLPPVVACYRKGHRDGMPVPVLLKDNKGLVFSIEDNGVSKGVFKPVIIRPFYDEGWRAVVDADSPRRWQALPPDKNRARPGFAAAAPYLIQLSSGETALSVQFRKAGEKNRTLCVYIGDASARNFGRPTFPLPNLPEGANAEWNSLCQIDENTLMAVSDIKGLPEKNGIWVITARIKRAAK